jgi:lipoprotein-anchoring transpeptidase ErfK/SrfK
VLEEHTNRVSKTVAWGLLLLFILALALFTVITSYQVPTAAEREPDGIATATAQANIAATTRVTQAIATRTTTAKLTSIAKQIEATATTQVEATRVALVAAAAKASAVPTIHAQETAKAEEAARATSTAVAEQTATAVTQFCAENIGSRVGAADKWIDVSLSTQRLIACQGDKVVLTTLVSSGKAGFETWEGKFYIYSKVPSRRLRMTRHGETWDIPDVPHLMYFAPNLAIHGTYWHDDFGQPVSHGCVNVPVSVAMELYKWAPVGTLVDVHR